MKTQQAKKRQIHIFDKNDMYKVFIVVSNMKITKFRSMAIQMDVSKNIFGNIHLSAIDLNFVPYFWKHPFVLPLT